MNRYFIKKYAMSEKGASNLSKAIFSRTILNFTKLFPPIIAFTFLFQYLGVFSYYSYDACSNVYCCKVGLQKALY